MKIKNILVPIDFSDCAKNALKNAIELAKLSEARLTLLNAFHVPVPHSPVGTATIVQTLAHEVEEVAIEDFKKLKNEFPELDAMQCKFVVEHGFAIDRILAGIKTYQSDLIVMGTVGASGVEEVVLGSNTNRIIKQSSVPVLAIPSDASIADISNIVLASDYGEIHDYEKLAAIKTIVDLFHANLHVIHIGKKPMIDEDSVIGARSLERALKGLDKTYNYINHNNFEEALFKFVAEKDIDMLAMLPREHNWIERILMVSHTRKIVFHTKIPLLTIKI